MRAIINDRRYGALKTLGEKKQAFNEVTFSEHSMNVSPEVSVCIYFGNEYFALVFNYLLVGWLLIWLCIMLKYLMQRKKLEAEERRLRQRKAKEEFTKMLEVWSLTFWVILYFVWVPVIDLMSVYDSFASQESKELTSSTRWRYISLSLSLSIFS